jgi:hypothetical protein
LTWDEVEVAIIERVTSYALCGYERQGFIGASEMQLQVRCNNAGYTVLCIKSVHGMEVGAKTS